MTAVKDTSQTKGYQSMPYVVVECECGLRDVVLLYTVKTSATGVCKRCYQGRSHGMSNDGTGKRTKIYGTWKAIRQRALNRSGRHPTYANIDIDPRWDDSFETFYEDMGEPPTAEHSIDRIDNTKGYWPWNCRWATSKQQQRNKSNNKHITYNGVTRTLPEWADILNIAYKTLWKRLDDGWAVERAFTKGIA